ncbi:MAG: hypothetical protein GY906_17945 [bacterium]|nr:hypothetical protein [bacterium]
MTIRQYYHEWHNYLKREKYLDTWTFWHTIIPAISARIGLIWLEPWLVVTWVSTLAIVWEVVELRWAPMHTYGVNGMNYFRPWLNNTLSDIFVATLAAGLVVF